MNFQFCRPTVKSLACGGVFSMSAGIVNMLGNTSAKDFLHDLILNKKHCRYYIFNRRPSKEFGKVNSHQTPSQDEITEFLPKPV